MNKSHPGDWIAKLDLREVRDPETGRSSFRQVSNVGVAIREELEKAVGESIKSVREASGLSIDQVAYLLGIDMAEYSVYKGAALTIPIGRLLHLCEVLGSSIEEVCRPLFNYVEAGSEAGEKHRIAITRELLRFDAETLSDIYAVLRHLA